jgi:hypothetical protein
MIYYDDKHVHLKLMKYRKSEEVKSNFMAYSSVTDTASHLHGMSRQPVWTQTHQQLQNFIVRKVIVSVAVSDFGPPISQ